MDRTITPDQVRLLFHEHLLNSIGPLLGALFLGALIALGIMSIFLLSSKGTGSTRQRRIAQIYVVLVVTLVLGYEVETLIALNADAFPSFYEPLSDFLYMLNIMESLLPLVVISLTDGLLVWRCFMVQRTLGPNSSKLQALFWIIPMCLWIVTLAAGFTVVGLSCAWRECGALSWCRHSTEVAETIAFLGNLILNLFATSYIVIRLLLHRRNLIYLYGRQHPTSQLMSIISILLESSAINAPIAIIAVVQVYTPAIRTKFLFFVVACQAFTSILIIYQVAIGRAFRHNCQSDAQDDAKEFDEERTSFTSAGMLSAVETMQSFRCS